jgi:hypothetical protein
MRSLLIGLSLVLSAHALAVEAILLPAHPLTGDGARVHVLRLYLTDGGQLVHPALPELHATHGAVVGSPVSLPDGGYGVRYRPPKVRGPESDSLRGTVNGKPIEAHVALEPPGRSQLTLTVSPDPLLLGKNAQAEVRLSARDPSGRPMRAPLRLGVSVGKVSPLTETGPGEYRATYTPPEERFPQVAILAAMSLADGGFSAVPLKLAARVPVSGEAEPGASMQILVDGKPFGPEPVGADGKFTVAIVVPPGGRAVGVSTDAAGNQRRREIDLALPSFPRLVLAAVPNELPADGRAHADVVAFAVDARGNPERVRAPAVSADAGTLSSPQARGDGLFSWTFTAPNGVTPDGKATLHAASSATQLKLRPAPPFHIELEPSEPLAAGQTEPQQLVVRVSDGSGSGVGGAKLTATLLGGRVLGVKELGGGRYALRVVPPKDPGRGATQLHVELSSLIAGAPRRVTLHEVRAPEGRVAAEAWVDDDLGLPVPGTPVILRGPDVEVERTTDSFGTAKIELPRPASERFTLTAEPAALPGLGAALDFVTFPKLRVAVPSIAGHGVVTGVDSAPGASLDADVALHPAAPVDLRVSADTAEVWPRESVRLKVSLQGAGAIAYQSSGGALELTRPLDHGVAELRFTPPSDAKPGAVFVVSVTEPKSRVTAFVQVKVR